MSKICENCAFAQKVEFKYECRRFPPKTSKFPIVNSDDWCGEFKAKPFNSFNMKVFS